MWGLWLSLQQPDDRKLTLISNSLNDNRGPPRGQCLLEHNSCGFTVHGNARAVQLCPETPGRAGRGEAGAPPAPAPAAGLSPVRREASACPLVKG